VNLIKIQSEEFAISLLEKFLGLQFVLSYTARRLKLRILFLTGIWIYVFVMSREFRGIVMGQALISGSLTNVCKKKITHLTKERTMVSIGL